MGEKNYLINRDSGPEEVQIENLTMKVSVIILGKKYYFETLKTFPFSGIKEIKSAIAIDISEFSPFNTDLFFMRKIGQENDSTRVNLWFVDEKIVEPIRSRSPLIIIPETALISFLEDDTRKIYSIDKDGETLLVYVGRDGVVKSTAAGRGKDDLESFRRSIGVEARDCSIRDLNGAEEYLPLLPRILDEIPWRVLLYFLNTGFFSLSDHQKFLKIGTAATAALFIIYTGIINLLPYFAEKKFQKEDQALTLNLSDPLKKQAMIEVYYKQQKALAGNINNYTYKLPLINLLNGVLPEETIIRQLVISGRTVEIKGVTPKASELLSLLAKANEIENARFNSPIKEDKITGMENFALDFIYRQGN